MVMVKMRDGRLARAPDTISDDELKRLGATRAFNDTPAQTPVRDRQRSDIDRRKQNIERATKGDDTTILGRIAKYTNPLNLFGLSDFGDSVGSGATLHADAPLAGVAAGAGALVRGQGISGAKQAFHNARQAVDELRTEREARSPTQALAGELVGAMAIPMGAGTGALKLASKVAPKAIEAARASRIAKIMSATPVQAAGAGALQGGATAGFDTRDGNIAENVAGGAGLGALVGGTVGGAVNIGGRMIGTLADRTKAAGPRVAAEKIAAMLGRVRDDAGKPMGIDDVLADVRVGQKSGSSPVLADYSPEMQGALAYGARRPSSEAANLAATRASQRIEGAPQRFDDKIDNMFGKGEEVNAYGAVQGVKAKRKAHGKENFTDDVMDMKIVPSDRLRTIIENPTPTLRKGMERAAEGVRGWRDPDTLMPLDPTQAGLKFNKQGILEKYEMPNMRTFHELKMSYDGMIGEALDNNDRTVAKKLSDELSLIKAEIGKVNPQYAKSLAGQRDLFQRETALEFGQTFLQRLDKEPRALLDEIKNTPKEYLDELIYGIADGFKAVSGKASGRNPIGGLRNMMRNKEKRQVLEAVFGDRAKLNEFDRFMRREMRASTTDNLSRLERQSITGSLKMQGDSMDAEGAVQNMTRGGITGLGFGGPIGLVSGIWRGYEASTKFLSPHALDELTNILSSSGKGVKESIDKAAKFNAARAARLKNRAIRLGKGVGTYPAGLAGD